MSNNHFKYRSVLTAVLMVSSVLTVSVLTVSVAHAEYFGLPSGRTAKFTTQPSLAIEAAYSNGEFASVDYQQTGVRLTYQYSPKILMFGDLGQSELSSESENSFGLGAYYSLNQSILGSDNSAVKVSLHQVNFDRISSTSGGGVKPVQKCSWQYPVTLGGWLDTGGLSPDYECELDVETTSGSTTTSGGAIRNIAFELLISGAMSGYILGDGANWYANGGVQLFNGAVEDDTVLGFGIGIVLPISESEFYAGFDYADDTYMGIGYRYFVK